MSAAATGEGFALAKLENCPKCHMALCQCPGAGGWRDISSAPKDGVVLGYSPAAREQRRIIAVVMKDGKPFIVGGVFAFDAEPVTHWMPRPSPPEKAQ